MKTNKNVTEGGGGPPDFCWQLRVESGKYPTVISTNFLNYL
jgi:hypothetical protein